MLSYQGLNLLKDEKLKPHNGIKYIIENILTGKPFILYFLSPECEVKSSIIKELTGKYQDDLPESLLKNLKLAALDFQAETALKGIHGIDENSLVSIYAYYSKFKSLPQYLLQQLMQYPKERDIDDRVNYLVNILLAAYYLNNNNFDLAESHTKFCIEYLNYNLDNSEYEDMVSYIIFGKYLEKTMDIFVSYADNYYNLALDLAQKLNDEISCASILSFLAYYYHNVEERDKSIKFAQKALNISVELGIPVLCFNANKILSIISLTIGDYKLGSEYMKKSIEASEKVQFFSAIESVKLKNTLGYIYYLKGNFKESLDIHLDAFKSLSSIPSVSDILEEAVKTFDNLSNSFKLLGNINEALYFADKTIKIIEDCNYGHRINDIQNLCKVYTDIGLLFGLYLDDYKNALHYYNLAKDNISQNDHYIKLGNLTILEAYIYYATGNSNKAISSFESSLRIFYEHGNSNIYVQSLLISYYLYFARKLPQCEVDFTDKALKIAEKFNLKEHFDFYCDYFINNKSFDFANYEEAKFSLNLIMLLSSERKNTLAESKKSRDFELIQNFTNKISMILSIEELYNEAKGLFNNYFFSKGFITIKHNFKEGFKSNVELHSDIAVSAEALSDFLKEFIVNNNLILNSHGRSYDIFNHELENSCIIKSMIIYYVYDEATSSTYYFIVFYDRRSAWLFSKEDAEVGLVLIKNLFLKLKSIEYTENIKTNAFLDFATGLYNAKYMWARLKELFSLQGAYTKGFSMAVLDLNDFKNINDTYGHYAGDEAIKFFSKMLKLALPGIDDIIRYGGDEFIIIFPEKSQEEAEESLENIKHLCASQPFLFNESRIQLDFSYGIEAYSESFASSKAFFESIDKKMYSYKHMSKTQKHKI